MYDFEWDKGNRNKNRIKHGIITKEAESAFTQIIQLLKDTVHSKSEQRYILIGKSYKNRWLFISFTIRNEKIRIISTRRMHNKERKQYE